ncbi:hypothetical protein [Virgibacillus pantothenticus]|nr:hypothetical protein [Virgibacillus pantothenticus]
MIARKQRGRSKRPANPNVMEEYVIILFKQYRGLLEKYLITTA